VRAPAGDPASELVRLPACLPAQVKNIKTYTKETDLNQSVPFLPVLLATVVRAPGPPPPRAAACPAALAESCCWLGLPVRRG
jgi:hypothetical protein